MILKINQLVLLALTSMLFCLTSINIQAQPKQGIVNVYAPSNVESLVHKYRYLNQNSEEVDGWRIQVIQTTNRDQVLALRARFREQFPNVKTYLDYVQPYFKLRAGNFMDRLEAYRFYLKVKNSYDRAFLVPCPVPKSKALH